MFGKGLPLIRRRKEAPFLGLDVGNYSVKVLKFGLKSRLMNNSGPVVESVLEKEIPLRVRQSKRDLEALAEVVRACLAEGGIEPKGNVAIMITGANAFIRRILMPPMPHDELESVMPFEAAKFVPFPIEQAVLDYTVVCERKEEDVKKQDILLVATSKEVLEQEVTIARATGLEPVAASVAPIALWNTFQLSETGAEKEIVALIDIGYKRSTICFFNNGILEFARTINVGGNDVTESLMSTALSEGEESRRTLTYEEAEAIKLKYGFPPAGDTHTTQEGIALSQVSTLMRPVLEKLLNEMRISFDFYGTNFQAPSLDKIIISGGGAMLKGLKGFLAGELGIEVETANPFQKMDFAGDVSKEDVIKVSPAFAAVFGLASWEAGDLSLLPQSKVRMGQTPVTVLTAIGLATALVIGSLYWVTQREKAAYEQELKMKVARLAEFGRIGVRTIELAAKRKRLMEELNTFPRELRESIDCANSLRELRLALPNNIRLKEVNIAPLTFESGKGKKEIKIKGMSFATDEKGPSVSDFMTALEDSSVFDDVRLISLEADKNYTAECSRFQVSSQCNSIGG
jgi:type IV pilus assembly protein PilM